MANWVLDMDCFELVVLFSVSLVGARLPLGRFSLMGQSTVSFLSQVHCLGGMIAILRLSSLLNVYYFNTMLIFIHPLSASHLISHSECFDKYRIHCQAFRVLHPLPNV